MSSPIGDMVVRIVGDNASFDKSIDNSSAKFQKFGDLAMTIGKNMTVGLTLPIVGAGVAALKSAGQMQLYQASFETMLGSADKAATMISKMQEMAAATPFELGDLAESGKMLLQYGIAADKIMPMIKTLGDVSQGSSAKLQTLSLAFGQMSSTGKLMGQDLLQMINAGFNPLFEISQRTGESMGSLKDKMSKGLITVDMVTESFKRATSEGGKFYGGMEKASKTLPGLMSTLKDDVATMGRSFVEDLMPMVMEAVKGLSSFAQAMTNLDAPTKAFIVTMLGFIAAAGPLAIAIGTISKALIFLAANPIVAVIAGIGLLVAALVSLKNASDARYLEDVGKRFEDLSKKTGVLPKQIDDITEAINRQSGNTLADMVYQLERMSLQFGVSKEAIIAIALANENVTGAYRNQWLELKRQSDEMKAMDIARNGMAHKAEIDAEKNRAATEEQVKIEKARLKILTDARNVLGLEYQKSIQETNRLLEAGLISEADAHQRTYEAAEKHAKGLAVLGYNGKEVNGVWNIGNRLLKEMKDVMRDNITRNYELYDIVGKLGDAELSQNEKERASLIQQIVDSDLLIEEKKKLIQKTNEYYDVLKKTDAINAFVTNTNNVIQSVLASFQQLFSAITQSQLEELDAQMQAEEEAAGVAEETAVQKARKELAEAQASGNGQVIIEAEKALKKAEIEEKYQKKRQELEYKASLVSWRLQLAATVASAAQAISGALAAPPYWPYNSASVALATILAGIQTAAVAEAKPVKSYATGGYQPPVSDGVLANVAENGSGEYMFNEGRTGDPWSKKMAGFIADDLLPFLNNVTRAIDFTLNIDSVRVAKVLAPVYENGQVRLKI